MLVSKHCKAVETANLSAGSEMLSKSDAEWFLRTITAVANCLTVGRMSLEVSRRLFSVGSPLGGFACFLERGVLVFDGEACCVLSLAVTDVGCDGLCAVGWSFEMIRAVSVGFTICESEGRIMWNNNNDQDVCCIVTVVVLGHPIRIVVYAVVVVVVVGVTLL